MKIGLFNHSDNLGGAARATYRIHKSLINEGIDSTLYVTHKTINDPLIKKSSHFVDRTFSSIKPKISSLITRALNFNSNNYNSISITPSYWPKFINNSTLDIIHLNWVNAEMMSIEDIGKISKPIVWTFHDMWPMLGSAHLAENSIHNNEEVNKLKKIDKWVYLRKKKNWRNPINIVTPSRWLENLAKQSSLLNNWPIITIPHPIDTNYWKPDPEENSRDLIGLRSKKTIILYGADGGTLSSNKGFDLLNKSLVKIQNYRKDFVLCIFGGKKDFKINSNFEIINFGEIKEDKVLRQIYRSADICVIPSRQESFCQVALEAQSCGVPVIAFSVGGLKDIVEHNVTGQLIEPFNTDSFALAIKNFIQNKTNYINFRKDSRKRAESLFSMSKISKQYFDLYKKILPQ